MLAVNELENMSKGTLISIYRCANYWMWPGILGEEPEGWDSMPNYRKPYMGECQTKEDIIRPYIRKIRELVPWDDLQIPRELISLYSQLSF